MGLWGRLWNLFYLWKAPWDIEGPHPELVRLVESGRLGPCRAIDMGCGAGDNVIYLAQQGFEVTGVDISPLAISKARRKAQAAGVSPTFLVGDVTNLTGVKGPFDLVVDNGCLHSLVGNPARDGYVWTVLRLIRPGSRYFLRCFVRDPRQRFGCWFFRGLSGLDLTKSEVERRFGGEFDIEHLEPLPPGLNSFSPLAIDAVYLMMRKELKA